MPLLAKAIDALLAPFNGHPIYMPRRTAPRPYDGPTTSPCSCRHCQLLHKEAVLGRASVKGLQVRGEGLADFLRRIQ